jgi:ribosome-binding ATPase
VGIAGLPGSGRTTVFNALTHAGGTAAKENVGMAQIADERLEQVARVVGAKKMTPAALRVVDVPGMGAAYLGNMRQLDALLAVLDGYSDGADPERDLEALRLELLVADRDHVVRRIERVVKQAKSGDPKLRAEVEELERILAHIDQERSLSEWERPLPEGLEPLTTKPIVPLVNGPDGIDAKLEAELAELPEDEAAAYRDGPSALDEVVRRLFEAVDLITFITAGDTDTRAWTLRRGGTALDAAAQIHTDIARGFIRCEVIRWDDLVELGSHAAARKVGKERLEGKAYVVQDGDVINVRFNV